MDLRSKGWRRGGALALLFAALASGTAAQDAAQEPFARDLREEIQHLQVSVADAYGRRETLNIPVTIFRPPGDGPFPLVVLNHGRPTTARRAQQKRARYDPLARYLVSKGFTVFVPTRAGYAETYGAFDPEDMGGCASPRLQPAAVAASDQVLATVEFARTLPYVDARRWIVMGQSLGGFASVAVASRNPPGLVGAVNFSGGHGGNPEARPGDSCADAAIQRLWAGEAATARVPMLWLYWQNDLYWGAEAPKRWHQAWVDQGGQAEFHQLPPVGKDGHQGTEADMDHWVPLMERFLAGLGFTQSGVPPRPAASGFAAVTDLGKVPDQAGHSELYRRFLAMAKPRAVALGADGAIGVATGDWAVGRALGFCQQRRGAPCRLYAIDDEVVWQP